MPPHEGFRAKPGGVGGRASECLLARLGGSVQKYPPRDGEYEHIRKGTLRLAKRPSRCHLMTTAVQRPALMPKSKNLGAGFFCAQAGAGLRGDPRAPQPARIMAKAARNTTCAGWQKARSRATHQKRTGTPRSTKSSSGPVFSTPRHSQSRPMIKFAQKKAHGTLLCCARPCLCVFGVGRCAFPACAHL